MYQRPTSKRLHATDRIKEARKEGKHTTHDLDSDVEEQHINKISNKTSEKEPCFHIDVEDNSFQMFYLKFC